MASADMLAPGAPDVAIVDTETTGFKPSKGDRILELAVVRVAADGTLVSRWATLLNPGPGVPLGATEIHGITSEMLSDAPTFKDVIGDFVEQVRGAVIGAHNTPFDVSFLEAEFRHAGYSWPSPPTADTLKASRALLPGLGSHKLGSVADHFGITFEGDAHSALADAVVTAKVYRELASMVAGLSWEDPSAVSWPQVAPSGLARTR